MTSPQITSEIPNTAMAAFRVEMTDRGIDLDEYEIQLYETSDQYIVVTRYKLKPPRLRGSVEGHPDFKVRISRETHAVLDVTFAR